MSFLTLLGMTDTGTQKVAQRGADVQLEAELAFLSSASDDQAFHVCGLLIDWSGRLRLLSICILSQCTKLGELPMN